MSYRLDAGCGGIIFSSPIMAESDATVVSGPVAGSEFELKVVGSKFSVDVCYWKLSTTGCFNFCSILADRLRYSRMNLSSTSPQMLSRI